MNIIKWGVIGAGDIVRKRVAPALIDLPGCELTAISRGKAELAEAFAREFGAKRWYADWRELLADDEVDAVYIATPVFLHAEQTIAAAEAGKHVLCEKPMAMNAAECERMIDVCRANNVRLGIAYYRRFYPVLERVREILRSGEIGAPVFAQMNAFEYLDMPRDSDRHWFLEKAKSGGGPMMDFGCHRLEVLTDLFGGATAVESMTANIVFDREVEDTAAVLLRFGDGPCACVVVTHAANEPQDTLDIFGRLGSIHIPILNKGDVRIATAEGERTESHPPRANIHAPLIKDFADAVIQNRDPRVSGQVGRLIAELEDRIYSAGAAPV
jgi:predicted dehydrogenase